MPHRKYHIVLNSLAGTAGATGLTCDQLQQHCEHFGYAATVDADVDSPLDDRIRRALQSDAEVIVAAGGDGTATALANALVGTDKILAILPLGTANLLARDLGIPLDLEAALEALEHMEPRRIDVGEVNGRIFLHKVVIGLVPGIAAMREKMRGRTDIGAKIDFVRYVLRRIFQPRRLAMEINPREGELRIERVQAIAVANNDYDEGFARFFSRQRLDAGSLSLYVLRRVGLADLLRLAAEMYMGTWRQDEALEIENVSAVTLRTRKPVVRAMIDGEVQQLQMPLSFRIRPLALSVLSPVVEKQEPIAANAVPEALAGS